uniref:Putative mitochondrial protein n=1 Tax=Tanacetum cinerariifolium TaxID=118510 RepID=A0A6L2LPV9_TANCI|nr:putative mitochondrial protein [Tanacetum cinerariifolium]
MKWGVCGVMVVSKVLAWFQCIHAKGTPLFLIVTQTVLKELQKVVDQYDDVFALPKELPPQISYDNRIPLLEGTQPVNIRPYRHPPTQKDATEAMVKELLEAGVIKASNSLFASPIIMVKKKDNTWRMCVDYMQLNKNTVKDKFLITIIKELTDKLHGVAVFSKLDSRSGYHQIRMCEEDIAKTTFKTHQRDYEALVMPFGLTNAPSTFQALMNEVFKAFLRKFTLVFFDDILVYSQTMEDHVTHLQLALETIRRHKLCAKLSKCVFGITHVEYLDHVISKEGVSTEPNKKAMVEAPVLGLPDFNEPFVIETDASGVGLGIVLQQKGHPIAYLSKTPSPKHQSLSTYEKELLAVLMELERWRGYLLDKHFILKTDHFSLKYLLDQRITIPTQMKWLPKLMGYDYEVVYKKSSENEATDALSRLRNGNELLSIFVSSITTNLMKRERQTSGGQDANLKRELLKYFHKDSIGGHSRVKRSQKRMKQQADMSRFKREFVIGDMVFLKLQPHRQVTIRMGKQNKLSQKFYGPFKKYTGPPLNEDLIEVQQCNIKGSLLVQPMKLLARKMVRKHNKVVVYGLVQWANGTADDASWEDLEKLVVWKLKGGGGFE